MTKIGRRRGIALEQAVLGAAWGELVELGYTGFTLEGVAKRAGTSRPVLARRWPGRFELATAAIARYIADNPVDVPDLGNIRDEIACMFAQWSKRGMPVLHLFFEMSGELASRESSFARFKEEISNRGGTYDQVLERAIARGEIDPKKLTPRIASLPADLFRHEILMKWKPMSKRAMAEIIDDIFLPLVAKQRRP